MTGFGRRYEKNDLATLFNDLATQFNELAKYFMARSFFMVARSFLNVASSFLQHVLATEIDGNIILIGGIFIKNELCCGKDIIIGDVLMTSPYPTLSNTCLA